MADVQFDEEEISIRQASQKPTYAGNTTGLVKLILNLRLAKTESGANYVLIGTMVFCFVLTFIIISQYLL